MLLLLLTGVLLLPDSSLTTAQETCSRLSPSIGSNNQTQLSNSESVGYYLNTNEPAHCSGTITSVDYCYYGPNQHNRRAWGAALALYRSDGDSGYSRVSDEIILAKYAPLIAPSNDSVLQLNQFKCETYVLGQALTVKVGDIFGAFIFTDGALFGAVGGLDLVGDSNNGYQMMRASGNVNLSFEVTTTSFSNIRLPEEIDQLSVDSERRVLHVYANISGDVGTTPSISSVPTERSTMMSRVNTTETNFTVPDSISTPITSTPNANSDATTSKPSVITENLMPTTLSGTKTESDIMYSTKVSTESSTQLIPIAESSPQWSKIIGGVAGVIVITGILLSIAIVLAILIQRVRKGPRVSTKLALTLQLSAGTEAYSEPIDQIERVVTTELNDYAMIGPNTSDSKAAEQGTMEDDHFYFVLEGPKYTYTELLEKNKTEDIYEHVTRYREPAKQESDLYSQIKSFGIQQINRDSIQMQNHVLGSGQFGSVKSGIWNTGKSEVKVAVKSLNQGISEETRVKFLQEAAIMAQFRHPNVALLYGVVVEGEPIMLVVELVEKGDLRKYLMSIKSNPGEMSSDDLPSLLLSFSQHVALGMQYLSGKGFVHRDLAARNILISKDNICKVADFGMSRDLAEENYYVSHGGMIPVKWTAPEAINYKKYSTASDVWSYGCLLYEIWSLALKPFEKPSNLEVIQMLDAGVRLAPPSGCPKMIYELMIQCWHPTNTGRPSFRELFLALTGDKSQVLLIPQADGETHPLAGVLGSPLEAGKKMYRELQNKYIV